MRRLAITIVAPSTAIGPVSVQAPSASEVIEMPEEMLGT
jgi:hypothetical protein